MRRSGVEALVDHVSQQYPHFSAGIEEATAVDPVRFSQIGGMHLEWAERIWGSTAVERLVDAFVQFTTDVNLAQARYEVDGRYAHRSFDEVYQTHYGRNERMADYLWGVYLTNFLWAHHLEIGIFYQDRFLKRLPATSKIVEIAPGHGGWGVWALRELPQATLSGYDISPASLDIAAGVSHAAGVDQRAEYSTRDAHDLVELPGEAADAVICCFLIEHLEDPSRLYDVIRHLLRPGGRAFLTGALTAAQIDHIYEFHRESELISMAEASGLRATETLSVNPRRLLPKARFVPRSMALLLEKGAPADGPSGRDEREPQQAI